MRIFGRGFLLLKKKQKINSINSYTGYNNSRREHQQLLDEMLKAK